MGIPLAEQEVRERAYQLWEARGRPDGSAAEDWFTAQSQLERELESAASPLEPLAQKAADVLEDESKKARH